MQLQAISNEPIEPDSARNAGGDRNGCARDLLRFSHVHFVATGLLILLLPWGARQSAGNLDEGLVAHWKADHETSRVLIDRSGNGNHGQIHGAQLIRGKDGSALRFDGSADYVSFDQSAGLTFNDAATLSAWVYLEGVSAQEATIVGRPKAFGLAQHMMTPHCVWRAVGHIRFYCSAIVGRGRWRHVVGTFDGKTLKLYLDGQLRQASISDISAIDNSGEFVIGRGSKGFFKGALAEVRLYRRALSDREVNALFSHKPGLGEDEIRHAAGKATETRIQPAELSISPYLYYFDRRLVVVLDGYGKSTSGASVQVALMKGGQNIRVKKLKISSLAFSSETQVSFTGLDLAPGNYQVRATMVDAKGRPLGGETVESLNWPSGPRSQSKGRVLNSLVTELLSVTDKDDAGVSHEFINPRDGWVLVAFAGDTSSSERILITINSDRQEDRLALHKSTDPYTFEVMRWLPAGKHRVRVWSAKLRRLVIRAIPELIYSGFPQQPRISAFGAYDWNFLKKHVLDHINTISLSGGAQHTKKGGVEDDQFTREEPYVLEAKQDGKRWLTESVVPGMRRGYEPNSTISAEEAYRFWAGNPGFQRRLLDGVIQLYSLKMVTGDYQKLVEGKTEPERLALSVKVTGAEPVPSRCFQEVFSSVVPNDLGAGGLNSFPMNYHRWVFRARAPRARLIVSDWAGPKDPGGPIGQEIIYNFIEVQPYLEE